MSRSYNQYCALAKALDVVGDRWSLLIVRELLIRGPSRYTDIRHGLPGIATNLLAERLRELERAGLLVREEAPPPVATTVFELTDWGRALEPILLQLGAWGAPLLRSPSDEDELLGHWIVLPLRLFLADSSPKKGPARIQLVADEVGIVIDVDRGAVKVALGSLRDWDARVDGEALDVLQLMTGQISLSQARSRGVRLDGDRDAVARVIPGRAGRPAAVGNDIKSRQKVRRQRA